jgi:hypothetical protein
VFGAFRRTLHDTEAGIAASGARGDADGRVADAPFSRLGSSPAQQHRGDDTDQQTEDCTDPDLPGGQEYVAIPERDADPPRTVPPEDGVEATMLGRARHQRRKTNVS